ncbi:response regulator [Paenibacillus sp. J2TS4]|uniref:response regulator n=1 Tax=Paenibacillus sp. J2TS4 TaxID=2807194 RepID=UPI001B0A73E9|nr:response regulator [Paenibacillus sp. J2TS4]GIP34985.1 hypothetical protein J2TS4_41950 [Paenibacillus sp. J2TS4]
MKVLVVDDEQHVRDAIKLLMDWERYGISSVYEASDVQSAIAIMKREQPEIVFTDMIMPGQSGVELLEWIQHHAGLTKAIVISGHDDFEYVRGTVKHGGIDYILKPIDPEELHAAVSKAVQLREEEEQERSRERRRTIEMNQIKPVYWDQMFSQLLNEPSYYRSIRENLRDEFKIAPLTHPECQVAILHLDTMNRRVRQKFASGKDLLFFSLINICNEFLTAEGRGYAFRCWNSASEIVLLLWEDLSASGSLLESLNEAIGRTLGGRFEFGLGRVHPFPEGLPESFREAGIALRQRDLLRRSRWIHPYLPEQETAPSLSLHLTDFEESLRFAVSSGQERRITEAVGRWFEAVARLPLIPLQQFELWIQEYEVLRTAWHNQYAADAEDPERTNARMREQGPCIIPLTDEGTLSVEQWRKELTGSLMELSRRIEENRKRERNGIYEIERYIRQHYDEEVALHDLSARFHLSREYISRKFKQVFGENLSDYTTRIRMSKAKELLANRNLKVAQVAAMVGYVDEKYFSKVFKKYEGHTPNEYRMRHKGKDDSATSESGR